MARVSKNLDAHIAHMRGVRAAVRDKAEEVEDTARALLAQHREEGEARIELSAAGGPDYLVSLVDPAALSIEYGRSEYVRKDGVKVGAMEGLYIMTRAAGL